MPTTARDQRTGRYARPSRCPAPRSGYSLVEVLCATALSGMIMAAVMASFLMLGRTGTTAASYATMEQQARGALERFGQDVRMARAVTTISATRVQLTIPHATSNTTYTVIYSYDSTARTFSRIGPDPVTGAANTTTLLIRDVANCEFRRWLLGSIGPASSDAATDQLQIRLTIAKANATTVTATNLVVSARFVLRNHRTGMTA